MSSTYGVHPTLYSGMEDMALYAMFRQETWSQLGEASRQQLLQETVNRAARENGEKGSCLVEFASLSPHVAGEQGNGVIYLNREMYVNDQQTVSYKGQLYTRPYTTSNLDALNTVLHEDQHAYQCQILDGTIQAQDPALAQEYAANNFTPVPLPQPDGTMKLGSTYLQGETPLTGRYLYYFQSTERDAHQVAEQKTLAILEALEARYGTEPSFQAYRQEVAVNGYQSMLAEAQQLFGSQTVEREINQSLINHYYGLQVPVDSRVEAVMQEEMAASFAAQNRLELNAEAVRTGTAAQTAAVSSLGEPSTEAAPTAPEAGPSVSEAGPAASEVGPAASEAGPAASAPSDSGPSAQDGMDSGGGIDGGMDSGGGIDGGMDSGGGIDGGMDSGGGMDGGMDSDGGME